MIANGTTTPLPNVFASPAAWIAHTTRGRRGAKLARYAAMRRTARALYYWAMYAGERNDDRGVPDGRGRVATSSSTDARGAPPARATASPRGAAAPRATARCARPGRRRR